MRSASSSFGSGRQWRRGAARAGKEDGEARGRARGVWLERGVTPPPLDAPGAPAVASPYFLYAGAPCGRARFAPWARCRSRAPRVIDSKLGKRKMCFLGLCVSRFWLISRPNLEKAQLEEMFYSLNSTSLSKGSTRESQFKCGLNSNFEISPR